MTKPLDQALMDSAYNCLLFLAFYVSSRGKLYTITYGITLAVLSFYRNQVKKEFNLTHDSADNMYVFWPDDNFI